MDDTIVERAHNVYGQDQEEALAAPVGSHVTLCRSIKKGAATPAGTGAKRKNTGRTATSKGRKARG